QTVVTKVALITEYDGANYHGSQWQAGLITIQKVVEQALKKLTGEKLRVLMASRTDAGVHARGQVISFRTHSTLPLLAYVRGLNYYLPEDIAVKEAFRIDLNFDVRRRAVSREYRYSIVNRPARSPLLRNYDYWVIGELDIPAMNQACQALLGKKDFASFATKAEKGMRTVREVYRAEVKREGERVILDMTANAFLPHQIRNTVGALIRVGKGKMTVADFNNIVQAKKPGLAGPTAPASGLCLMKVNYPVSWGENNENL
ncbi:MAG: tRNA pseudouridine(38-40) synthase TruA, partial [Dehalococcoidales bacterium]|nr:tRNA pseudouridine(38-40) synthase TruA [Dehalococcoidales bacterium]